MTPTIPIHTRIAFGHTFQRTLALAFITLICACFHATFAQALSVVSWNVESGGFDNEAIRRRIGSFQRVDLWELSEVANPAAATIFEAGAEEGKDANFDKVVGTTALIYL